MTRDRSPLLATLLLVFSVISTQASAWRADPGYVPLRNNLPNAIDMLESGFYWMQDLQGVQDLRDPASVISLLEDQVSRFFDFSYMSYQVGGPEYTRLNVLQRSHFQNQLRDELFETLAYHLGLYSNRLPRVQPVMPTPSGRYGWQVGAILHHRGAPSNRLMLQFYLSSRGWKIFDVTSNGYSLLAEIRKRRYHD